MKQKNDRGEMGPMQAEQRAEAGSGEPEGQQPLGAGGAGGCKPPAAGGAGGSKPPAGRSDASREQSNHPAPQWAQLHQGAEASSSTHTGRKGIGGNTEV